VCTVYLTATAPLLLYLSKWITLSQHFCMPNVLYKDIIVVLSDNKNIVLWPSITLWHSIFLWHSYSSVYLNISLSWVWYILATWRNTECLREAFRIRYSCTIQWQTSKSTYRLITNCKTNENPAVNEVQNDLSSVLLFHYHIFYFTIIP
jgi:hypothetical protein